MIDLNIFFQVFGGLWYILAVINQMGCWNKACGSHRGECFIKKDGFWTSSGDYRFLNDMCSNISDNTFFHFGIFREAIENGIIYKPNLRKILYCFRWGIQNIRLVNLLFVYLRFFYFLF